MKIIQEIQTLTSLEELTRSENTITAYDGHQQLIQIDLKHSIFFPHKLQYPPLSVKAFRIAGKNKYIFTHLNQIESQGRVISKSNSKAEYTGIIDSHLDNIFFTKYHHHFKKYSLNILLSEKQDKSIFRLFDQPLKKLFCNRVHPTQLIYSINSNVYKIDLNSSDKEEMLMKKSNVYFDSYHLYFLMNNIENKSKEEFEVGIFDFRTGKNSDSWIVRDVPKKIELFGQSVFVGYENAIEVYDTRKLIKPYERDGIKGLKDFLLQANIQKLFIGTESKLKTLRFEHK